MESPKTYTDNPIKNQSQKATATFNRGITLMEILVVIGIFSIIAGFSSFMGIDSFKRALSKNDVGTIVRMISKARSQAMNNICLNVLCDEGKPHGFHIENDSYTIFQGTVYDPADPQNEVIQTSGGISSISGVSNIIFNQLAGDVTVPGTIHITDQSARSYDISINSEGRINVTNL